MKPKHIQIDHKLLKSSAQAHPFRPIRTALQAQQLDNIRGPLPETLSELYRWMKREDLLNTIPPQRLWTQLMTVPMLCIPLSFGLGGLWWIFTGVGIPVGILGVAVKYFFEGGYLSSKLNLLELEPFVLITKELIVENNPMLDKLESACADRRLMLAETHQKTKAFVKLLRDLSSDTSSLSLDDHPQLKHLKELEELLTKQLHHFEQTRSKLMNRRRDLLNSAELTWLSQQGAALSEFALRAKAELELDEFDWSHHTEELDRFLKKSDVENRL